LGKYLIFIVSFLVIVNNFFLHKWLSIYLARWLHRLFKWYFFIFHVKNTLEQPDTWYFFLKKHLSHACQIHDFNVFLVFFLYPSFLKKIIFLLFTLGPFISFFLFIFLFFCDFFNVFFFTLFVCGNLFYTD
jgi:hypothetical protein